MRLIAKIDKFGRVLVPQKVRADLELKPGSEVVFNYDESSQRVELSTRQQALKAARAELAPYNSKGRSWSEEILKDRRQEMKRERSRHK